MSRSSPFHDRYTTAIQLLYNRHTKPIHNRYSIVSRPFHVGVMSFSCPFTTDGHRFMSVSCPFHVRFVTVSRPLQHHFMTITEPLHVPFVIISCPFHIRHTTVNQNRYATVTRPFHDCATPIRYATNTPPGFSHSMPVSCLFVRSQPFYIRFTLHDRYGTVTQHVTDRFTCLIPTFHKRAMSISCPYSDGFRIPAGSPVRAICSSRVY